MDTDLSTPFSGLGGYVQGEWAHCAHQGEMQMLNVETKFVVLSWIIIPESQVYVV